LWKLFSNFVERALPQVSCKRKHVCFVHQRQMFAFALCDALDPRGLALSPQGVQSAR
jgi:hypothetical protein